MSSNSQTTSLNDTWDRNRIHIYGYLLTLSFMLFQRAIMEGEYTITVINGFCCATYIHFMVSRTLSLREANPHMAIAIRNHIVLCLLFGAGLRFFIVTVGGLSWWSVLSVPLTVLLAFMNSNVQWFLHERWTAHLQKMQTLGERYWEKEFAL